MGTPCDSDFLDVALLLTFEGVDGQTAITDSSPAALAVTTVSSAALSSADPLYPPTAAAFTDNNGSGWHAPITPGAGLDLHQTAYTVECWFQTTKSGLQYFFSDNSDPFSGTDVLRAHVNGGTTITLQSIYTSGGGTADLNGTFNDGNWHHIVFSASSTQAGIAVDGIWGSLAGYTFDGAESVGPFFSVGYDEGSRQLVNGQGWVGQLSDFRVTRGVIRYPLGVNFTPPVQAFPTIDCAIPPVPNVIGESIGVATTNIEAAGFTVGSVATLPDVLTIKGNVLEQTPSGGAYAAPGAAIDLVLSSGRAGLFVPLILDLDLADAVTSITTIGLVAGAIGYMPSNLVPAGGVVLQNPTAGTPVAYGSIVSFVISTGPASSSTSFNVEATVISQYANSPTLDQLITNLSQYFDQSANFAAFYTYVWNVDTATGFGLDIWGKIVGVSRLLLIPNTTDYVGFDNSATPPPDWQTMGSDQPPQPAVGGAMYTGYNATQAYLLPDDAYRQLILAKAFANICTTTAPAINQILQNLFGAGTAWVLNTGVMSISYNLNFTPSAIQQAILEQSGVIPTPPGVSFVVNTDV